jgi:hypothetical protein
MNLHRLDNPTYSSSCDIGGSARDTTLTVVFQYNWASGIQEFAQPMEEPFEGL